MPFRRSCALPGFARSVFPKHSTARSGQYNSHRPQPTHSAGAYSGFPSPSSESAPERQNATHTPQPLHHCRLMRTFIGFLLWMPSDIPRFRMLIPAAAGIRRRHGTSLGQMALKGEALGEGNQVSPSPNLPSGAFFQRPLPLPGASLTPPLKRDASRSVGMPAGHLRPARQDRGIPACGLQRGSRCR